jgi:cytochrome P450
VLTQLAREHGGMAPLRLGRRSGYLVSEPELVGDVLVAKAKHYTRMTQVYRGMAEFLGAGLLTSEGEDWRVHRRMVQPAFHKRRLAALTDQIVTITTEMLDGWRGELDVSEAMMRLTLRVAGEVLLGTRADRDALEFGAAVAAVQRDLEVVMAELVPRPRTLPTRRNRAYRDALATLDRVAYRIIEARKRTGHRGDDAVSMLLEARYEDGHPLGLQRIRNELITLLAAGHETTSNALAWTLAHLSLQPELARRLVAEVDRVLGARPPTFEDLPQLVFTRRVFDEALRLHPPVWVTGRRVIEAHQLGGRQLTPGTMVLLSPYVTQRRPDLWERPETFDPDRWEALAPRGALAPYTYYPFGGGMRKCVGEAFAYLEAMVVLARIAQRLRLKRVPGRPIVPAPQITLSIGSGLWLEASPREPLAPPSVAS